MDDVANHMIRALDNITDMESPPDFDCNSEEEPWSFGAILQDQILKVYYYYYHFIKYILNPWKL